jgi:hypothetical protein
MKEGNTKHVEERLNCLLYYADTAVGYMNKQLRKQSTIRASPEMLNGKLKIEIKNIILAFQSFFLHAWSAK